MESPSHSLIFELAEFFADDAAAEVVLVGGQAVAVWFEYLASLGVLSSKRAAPVSNDIDFQGTRASVRRAADVLHGEAQFPELFNPSPSVGVVRYVGEDGSKKTIDSIDAPLGLERSTVEKSAITLRLALRTEGHEIKVRVMHPAHTMSSRITNFRLPSKDTPLAREQAAVSIECVRAFGMYLVDSGEEKLAMDLNEAVTRALAAPWQWRCAACTE